MAEEEKTKVQSEGEENSKSADGQSAPSSDTLETKQSASGTSAPEKTDAPSDNKTPAPDTAPDNLDDSDKADASNPAGGEPDTSDNAADGGGNDPDKKGKKGKKGKDDPSEKNPKSNAKMQKEWEDSIVASKKVKREEIRRKFKQAIVIMLVFALVVTSVVYVMLLFVQENNVRITAKSQQDKSISLSLDGSMWTPYLNAEGPDKIWNISYNPIYKGEHTETMAQVRERLCIASPELGVINGENYIRFVFLVKNTGKFDADIDYVMTLDNDDRNLQDAVRVMWAESFKSSDLTAEQTSVEVYAALSRNPRLADTNINYNRTPEMGYLEYCAYPFGSDDPKSSTYDLRAYERTLTGSAYDEAQEAGYFATTPFESDEAVFKRHTVLAVGDIMYCYVCIWLEGSDFDCVDSALGGFVKLGIDFVSY